MVKNRKLQLVTRVGLALALIITVWAIGCAKAPTPAPTPVPTPTKPTLERDVIKIGVAAALKKSYGEASLHGATIAADEINAAGGVLGAKIELFSGDTEATAPKATEVIEKLYYSDKVDAVVGAYSSEEATAFQSEAAKLKIPIIFHGTTNIMDENYASNPEKYKYYFNNINSETDWADAIIAHQIPLIVNAMKRELGLDSINVAVITDVALWTENLHKEVVAAVESRLDTNLVYTGKVSRDAVDFTAELAEVRAKEVQFIIVGLGYPAGFTLVRQLYELEVPAVLSGQLGLAWATTVFLDAVGLDAAAYVINDGIYMLPINPNTEKLIDEYVARFGKLPAMDVGSTYNAVKIYAKAVEMAGSLEPDKVVEQLQFACLPESEAWGCTKFVFKDNHRVLVHPEGLITFHYQITPEGKTVLVAPEIVKTHDVVLPPRVIEAWKK